MCSCEAQSEKVVHISVENPLNYLIEISCRIKLTWDCTLHISWVTLNCIAENLSNWSEITNNIMSLSLDMLDFKE